MALSNIAESYEEAAQRELGEELGIEAAPRFLLKFLCKGAISPYWLGVHEVVVTTPVQPDVQEIAWYGWLTEPELNALVRHEEFVPDTREAYDRYQVLDPPTRTNS